MQDVIDELNNKSLMAKGMLNADESIVYKKAADVLTKYQRKQNKKLKDKKENRTKNKTAKKSRKVNRRG